MRVSRPLLSSFTYTLSGKPNVVYVPITSRCNALTLPETRGPNFFLPSEVVASLCRFRDFETNNGIEKWTHWCMYLDSQEGPQKLPPPDNHGDAESSDATAGSLEYNPEIVPTLLRQLGAYKSIDSLVIAGEGEPTLRLTELLDLVQQFKAVNQNDNQTTIRLTTNGLVAMDGDDDNHGDNASAINHVVGSLQEAGVSHVSVALMTANADQYHRELMQPTCGGNHETVCEFIKEAIRVGLQVETTAVDRPDVDKEATEALSQELKVTTPVRWRPYFA